MSICEVLYNPTFTNFHEFLKALPLKATRVTLNLAEFPSHLKV